MQEYFRLLQTDIKRISQNVFQQFREHNCMHQAASLSFNTILCLVPLSAVALFLLKTFGVVDKDNSFLLATLNNYLPRYRADDIITSISEFTNRNLTGLGIGGFLLFLIISLILFMSIEGHFNRIWGSQRLPLLQAFQKYLVFYMLLLIGPLFVWIVFSSVSNVVLSNLLPWISVYFLFVLMFVALPNLSVNWKAALIGAFFAGTLFQIARTVFANYLELVWKNYTEIYGTLAMLIILAIWIYITWIIILLGVEVTYAIQKKIEIKKTITDSHDQHIDIINMSCIITLFLMVAIHFQKGKGACMISDLSKKTKISESVVKRIFDCFIAADLIYEVQSDTKGYIPTRSLDSITLETVISCVDGELTKHFIDAIDAPPDLTKMLEKVQETQTEQLKHITVSSLIEDIDPNNHQHGLAG